MATSVFRKGNTALITGGASGIGLALAKRCYKAGMKIALVDVNQKHLELAKKNVGEDSTHIYQMDVGSVEDWEALKKKVDSEFGRIDLLSLNAGASHKGDFHSAPSAYFQKTFSTNFFGITNGLSTFLSTIEASASAQNPSAIIITGSKQGITNPPGNPAYNASKAAVKSVAEGLAFSLRERKDIAVHLLVPGWTYTGLSGSNPANPNEGKPDGAWSGEQVVEYLEGKMDEGQFYVICPDNDVSVEMDKRRILWGAGDIVYGRKPLSRWNEETKDEAAEGVKNIKL